MLIVLLDEPGLFVFESPADAAREIEPFDAESQIRAAFYQMAVPYAVKWVRPNRYRQTLFGLCNSGPPAALLRIASRDRTKRIEPLTPDAL